ncbi:MAG: tetratricopeptide repeat protein [Candidatus Odinarchaeota archaeon]
MGENNDLFQRSVAAFTGGNPERAKQHILKLLEKDQNNLELLTFLTTIYQQYQQPQDALHTAERITQLDPSNPRHWNNLGYLNILLGRWKKAEACYAKATSLPNASPTIFLHHALTLIEIGQPKAALNELQHALAISLPGELETTIHTDPQFTKLRPLLAKIE